MSQTLHAETSARLCRDSSCELRSLHVKGANLRQQHSFSRANATSGSSYRSATAHARVLPWLSHALAVSTTADAICRSWNPPSASAFSLCITSIIFSLSAGCDSVMSSARPPECTVLSGVGRSTAHGGWPRPQRVRWTSPWTSRRCGWSQKWVHQLSQQMHDQLLRLLLCHLRRPCFVLVRLPRFLPCCTHTAMAKGFLFRSGVQWTTLQLRNRQQIRARDRGPHPLMSHRNRCVLGQQITCGRRKVRASSYAHTWGCWLVDSRVVGSS